MAHQPLTALAQAIEDAARHVAVGAQYAHYKDARRPYTVTALVILEDTEGVAVAYHVSSNPEVVFIRPLESWLETVQWQGHVVPRFTEFAILPSSYE